MEMAKEVEKQIDMEPVKGVVEDSRIGQVEVRCAVDSRVDVDYSMCEPCR